MQGSENDSTDPRLRLLIPDGDAVAPEFSIVIPALNEEITIGTFIDWCKEGIAAEAISADILIIDSSTDRTAEIALAHGARVLKCPKQGLGRAYIDAIPFIRGQYVLMGDADCTYDFRQLGAFAGEFRAGVEFVMGSRFRGSIESGAMPPVHRYFGTPLTTWILNVMYGTRFSDIHCGMRGITLDGLKRMELTSQSWEYASEMILKSIHLGLRTREVPVRFLKDQKGRVSHHSRIGWFSPWHAGWINLKAMFIFGADFFLMIPGSVLFVGGLIPLCILALGPVTIHGITLSLNAELLSLFTSVVGLQLFLFGAIAQSLYDRTGKKRGRWLAIFPYTPTVIGTACIFLLGAVLCARFITGFLSQNYAIDARLLALNHQALFGLYLIITCALVFISTLLIHAVDSYLPVAKAGHRTS